MVLELGFIPAKGYKAQSAKGKVYRLCLGATRGKLPKAVS
jgi:hypothetical protein